LPLFGEDLEREQGYPDALAELLDKVKSCDGLMISVNEHNGSISAFFKNVLDWLSRIEYKFLEGKKVLLMSASPGKRGALSAYEYTKGVLPRYGGEVLDGVNFPSFGDNYSAEEKKVSNADLSTQIEHAVSNFLTAID
ncbi:MAG: NAD(P)H-dependent oxidoreductase, partial [Bacteroidota bacterium]